MIDASRHLKQPHILGDYEALATLRIQPHGSSFYKTRWHWRHICQQDLHFVQGVGLLNEWAKGLHRWYNTINKRGEHSGTPKTTSATKLVSKTSDSDSEYRKNETTTREDNTYIHITTPIRKKDHTHTTTTKQDMSTTENRRRTDPNKQLGPRPHTYKKPPATVHGDNRALVWYLCNTTYSVYRQLAYNIGNKNKDN
jgi:hypothetical protein